MLDDVRLQLSTIQDKLSDMEMSWTNNKTEDDSLSKVSSLQPTPGPSQSLDALTKLFFTGHSVQDGGLYKDLQDIFRRTMSWMLPPSDLFQDVTRLKFS